MHRVYRAAVCASLVLTSPHATLADDTSLIAAGSPGYDSATGNGFQGTSLPVVPGRAVNNTGTAVGYSTKYDSGSSVGQRAVRWDAGGTAATELGNLGLSGNSTSARAYAVNDAGTAVGFSAKYVSGSSVGSRAVRWDAGGTAATELGNLGLNGNSTSAAAYAVNDAGTAVGYSQKYNDSGSFVGDRAVRWDAGGTAATELDDLGLNGNSTTAAAYAVNDAGTAVGYSQKYDDSGSSLGSRAVRWDAGGTAATELDNLGLSGNSTSARAYAVNDAGTAVGYSSKYNDSGSYVGDRAVIWLPDASAVDLNGLGVVANPNDGTWVLTSANALSTDGWVAGEGTFTPTTGAAYTRGWVAQVGLGGTWTDDFTGNLDGTWGRGNQWSTGTPAMQVGDATFSANAAYTVTLDRDETTKSIQANAGDVTLDLNGHTLKSLINSKIENGILRVNDGTLTSTVEVNSGGTLAGRGTVAGPVTVNAGGTLSPGNGPGSIETLTSGPVTFNDGSTFKFEIDSNLGTADLLNAMTGSLVISTIGAGVSLDLSDLGASLLAFGTKFTMISYNGEWNGGTFTGLDNLSFLTLGGNSFQIRYDDLTPGSNFLGETSLNTGGRFVTLTLTAVPEMSSFVTMGLVICLGLAALRFSKHRAYQL